MKPVIKLSLAVFLLYIVKIIVDCYNMQKILPPLDPAPVGVSRFDKSDRLLVQLNRFKSEFKGEMASKKYRNIIQKQISRIERVTGKKISKETIFSEGQIMFQPGKTKTE